MKVEIRFPAEGVGLGSNPRASAKYFNMFKDKLNKLINELNEIVKYVEENNLYNTQEYLDFEDYLNRISVRDHARTIPNK